MLHWNSVNLLLFSLLGATVLWAVRLAYEARQGPSDDTLKQLLLLCGWILVVAGLAGACIAACGFFAIIPIAGLLFAALSYSQYVTSERRSLLWSMAVAAEQGYPLEQAARAYADERSVQVGTRVAQLADLLEQGVPLPAALAISRNPLPADSLLAARLGAETGQMAASLRMSLDYGQRFDAILRQTLGKCLYLGVLLSAGGAILTFMLVKIVPVYSKMFQEFELDLPIATAMLVSVSSFFVKAWFLFPYVLMPPAFMLLAASTAYYVGLPRYEVPGLYRLRLRVDAALIMRALAMIVRERRDIHAAMVMLAQQYPGPGVARRLERAAGRIERGGHWADALRAVRLLQPSDVAVLKSAEKAENLAWALEEMSDRALRRHAYWLQCLLTILFPAVLIVIGAVVGLLVVSLMMPLASMIWGLA